MTDSQSQFGGIFLNRSWLYVGLTCLFEWVWIYGFNAANIWWHWILIVTFISIDFYFLSKACEELPTGTVYAIFAGVGTIGTAFMDVFFFGGKLNSQMILFIVIVVIGVIGLNIADYKEEKKATRKVVQ